MDYLSESGLNGQNQQIHNLSQPQTNYNDLVHAEHQHVYSTPEAFHNLSQPQNNNNYLVYAGQQHVYPTQEALHNFSQPQTNNYHLVHAPYQHVVPTQEQFQQMIIQSPKYHELLAKIQVWTFQRSLELRRKWMAEYALHNMTPFDWELAIPDERAKEEANGRLSRMMAEAYEKHVSILQEQQRNLSLVNSGSLPEKIPNNRNEPITIPDDEEAEQETLTAQPPVIVIADEEEQRKELEVEVPAQKPQEPRRREVPTWVRSAESDVFKKAMYPDWKANKVITIGKNEEETTLGNADKAYVAELRLARQLKAIRQIKRPSEPKDGEAAQISPQRRKKAGGRKRKHEDTVTPQGEQEQAVAPKRAPKKQKKTDGEAKKPTAPRKPAATKKPAAPKKVVAPTPSAPLTAPKIQRGFPPQQTKSDGLDNLLQNANEDDDDEELMSLLYEGMNAKVDTEVHAEEETKSIPLAGTNGGGFIDTKTQSVERIDSFTEAEMEVDGDDLFGDKDLEVVQTDSVVAVDLEVDGDDLFGDNDIEADTEVCSEEEMEKYLFEGMNGGVSIDNEPSPADQIKSSMSMEMKEDEDDLLGDNEIEADTVAYAEEDRNTLLGDNNVEPDLEICSEEEMGRYLSEAINGGAFIDNETWSAGEMDSFLAAEAEEDGDDLFGDKDVDVDTKACGEEDEDDLFEDDEVQANEETCAKKESAQVPSADVNDMNVGGFIDDETWSAGDMESFMDAEREEWEYDLTTQAPAGYRFDSDGEVSEEE